MVFYGIMSITLGLKLKHKGLSGPGAQYERKWNILLSGEHYLNGSVQYRITFFFYLWQYLAMQNLVLQVFRFPLMRTAATPPEVSGVLFVVFTSFQSNANVSVEQI